MSILVIGIVTKPMEKAFTSTVMALNMMENGKKISNMVLDLKLGWMELHIKVNICLGKKMGKEYLNGNHYFIQDLF